MEQVYGLIGRTWIYGCGAFLTIKLLSWIFVGTINRAGDNFKKMWYFIEYLYYRSDYKEWVKDKDRLPIIKKIKNKDQ